MSFVVERGLSRLAAEGVLVRLERLGSFGACSQVIRAHRVWRGNVERVAARITCSPAELEERMLHLELGFSSLFTYCVEALGMSEGTAGRRVAAARVCRRFPEVFERVSRGELHLCALCALAPHLSAGNAGELFEACRGKTRRQIEELLAARFPRPDVREQIRRLPVRVVPVVPVAAVEQASRSSRSSASLFPANSEAPAFVPNSAPMPVGKRGRYVAVAVRREVHHRDHGRCAFVSAEGRRCDARALLEFDHVQPLARFGATEARNIRLLCRAHNLLHARNCFGPLHIVAKIAASERPVLASYRVKP
ncbi:MAG TPA: HNH endonuclease [Polyangiaceae bacterium]|nr:HNH endonuclease [Polyangiaceae bacterium]